MEEGKDKYVLDRVKLYMTMCIDRGSDIKPEILKDLIAQLEFDYEVDKEYMTN